jgi:hypothetical protein
MQQLDTLKLAIPPEAVLGMNEAKFVLDTQTDCQTGVSKLKYTLKQTESPIGVSNLVWLQGQDLHLTFSAKVLKDDYLQGITADNWYRGLDVVKNIIQIDSNKVWESGIVHRADSTNNIFLDDIGVNSRTICTSLLASRGNQRFKDISYQSKRKLGVEFRGVQQEKNRMIFYDKSKDLLKSANRDFLKSLKNSTSMIETASRQLRAEVNHTAHKSFRDRFKVPDNKLKSILESTEPVNHNFLKKIMAVGDIKQTRLFDEYLNLEMSPNQYLKYKGIRSIIRDCNCDEPLVMNFLKLLYNNENSFKQAYYKGSYPIKKILEYEQANRFNIDVAVTNQIANKVLESLRVAV